MKIRSSLVCGLLVTLLFAFQQKAIAFDNEPEGFRGITWGTNLDKLDDMVVTEPLDDIGECCYERKNDKLKIGASIVESICYCSFRNKFYFVNIDINESNESKYYTKLVQPYHALYGRPQESHETLLGKSLIWKSNKVKILFVWWYGSYGSPPSPSGSITYEYLPIKEERDRARDRALEKAGERRRHKKAKEIEKDL